MNETQLFEFNEERRSVLVKPIAECLFHDLSLFGRMKPPKPEDIQRYLDDRAHVSLKYLRSLELVSGLRFHSSSKRPYCLLPKPGDQKSRDLFGYTGKLGGPLPSEVAWSWIDVWLTRGWDQAPPHLSRAVIGLVAQDGYKAAFNYLFDLLEAGYLTVGNMETASLMLTRLRGSVESDAKLIENLIGTGSRTPETHYDWMSSKLDIGWIDDGNRKNAYPEITIERAWREIWKLRDCENIDQWVSQVVTTAPALLILGALLDSSKNIGIAASAARDQLSEVSADICGHWLRQQEDGFGILSVIGYAVMAGSSSESQVGDEWLDRAFAERSALPRVVFDGIMRSREWPTDLWRDLSWRTICPWSAHHKRGEILSHRHGSYEGTGADSVYRKHLGRNLRVELDAAMADFGESKHHEALTRLESTLSAFPYSMMAHILRATVLDHLNRPVDALESAQAAVVLAPSFPDAWKVAARIAYVNDCEDDAQFLEMFGSALGSLQEDGHPAR